MKLDMQMFQQEIWVDGNEAYVNAFGEMSKLEGLQLEQMKFEATPFATCKLLDLGYKIDIKGKQNGQIVTIVTSPTNIQSTFYFDEKTYLLTKYETVEESPQGPAPLTVKFSNWIDIQGVKLPEKVENISTMLTMINDFKYELNTPMDDSIFKANK